MPATATAASGARRRSASSAPSSPAAAAACRRTAPAHRRIDGRRRRGPSRVPRGRFDRVAGAARRVLHRRAAGATACATASIPRREHDDRRGGIERPHRLDDVPDHRPAGEFVQHLGLADFIRVPSPAARTMAAKRGLLIRGSPKVHRGAKSLERNAISSAKVARTPSPANTQIVAGRMTGAGQSAE